MDAEFVSLITQPVDFSFVVVGIGAIGAALVVVKVASLALSHLLYAIDAAQDRRDDEEYYRDYENRN